MIHFSEGDNCELNCLKSPCLNGGKCTTDNLDNLKCNCPQNFTGSNCQFSLNNSSYACFGDPCKNGGFDSYLYKSKIFKTFTSFLIWFEKVPAKLVELVMFVNAWMAIVVYFHSKNQLKQ